MADPSAAVGEGRDGRGGPDGEFGVVFAAEELAGGGEDEQGETVVEGAAFGFQARKQIRLQDVWEVREASESGILRGVGWRDFCGAFAFCLALKF
jgi:hypothetical protein